MARLQHSAGNRPLLLAECGADSQRHGERGQAALASMQVRVAFSEGTCGAIVFSWTDEWWRGGVPVEDWSFGLVDGHRRPKAAHAAVTRAFDEAPFATTERRQWPAVSIVVCAYNAGDTIDDCLSALARVDYPHFEVIVVDGSTDETAGRATSFPWVRVIFNRIGLGQRWPYFDAHRSSWTGPAASSAPAICRTADVVLNLSGVNPLRAHFDHVTVRVLVDTDPVFTQIRHLTNPVARARADDHTAFLSFAENFGQPDCGVPADGFPWQPTRQPVVMDAWTPTPAPADGPLTTVMLWDSYRAAEHLGTRYGMNSDAFAPYLDLPPGCHRLWATDANRARLYATLGTAVSRPGRVLYLGGSMATSRAFFTVGAATALVDAGVQPVADAIFPRTRRGLYSGACRARGSGSVLLGIVRRSAVSVECRGAAGGVRVLGI